MVPSQAHFARSRRYAIVRVSDEEEADLSEQILKRGKWIMAFGDGIGSYNEIESQLPEAQAPFGVKSP